MKRVATLVVAVTFATTPPAWAAQPVRRFVVVDAGAPASTELERWDLRLRRWLEDRRVATETRAFPISTEVGRPWRELALGSGRPWESVSTPTARGRALQAAWNAFRTGRLGETESILRDLRRLGPVRALVPPWDWSDAEAFSPAADAFVRRLDEPAGPQCSWPDAPKSDRWVDGASVEGDVSLAVGVHATAWVQDGAITFGRVRCQRDGTLARAAADAMPFVAASGEHPAVVSFWSRERVFLVAVTDEAVAMTDSLGLDRSVALDAGGGPLAGLTLPAALAASHRLPAHPEPPLPQRSETTADAATSGGSSRWLWAVLGVAALAGGALWIHQRENAGRSGGLSVKWE